MAEKVFKAYINPLAFLEVDLPWAELRKDQVRPEDILNFATTPGAPTSLDELIERYKQISTEPQRLFAAPAEQRILDKLVWPLRHAKASYMLGNYLGTISLCGMVGEMVAILLFDLAALSVNDRPLTKDDQIGLFGSTFEKLGQERRVKVLRVYEFIDDDLRDTFDQLRLARRKYLHLWSQDHGVLPQDAVHAFHAATKLGIHVIGQDVNDGRIRLNPAIMRYLEQHGVYRERADSGAGQEETGR